MGCCSTASKCCLTIVGLLFFAFSASLIFIGTWIWTSFTHYTNIAETTYTLIPASIMLGTGVFMLVIATLACIGACKENKCVLATFFILLILVLMAETAASVMGYIYRHDVENSLRNGMDKALNMYENETFYKKEMDWLQEHLKCCGQNNATDWEHTSYFMNHNHTVPPSCCQKGVTMENSTHCDQHIPVNVTSWQIYTGGCFKSLKDKIMHYLAIIAAVLVSFAVIQIVGLISSIVLICRSKDAPYLHLDSSTGGYRV